MRSGARARRDDRGAAESAVAIVGVLVLIMLVLHASLFWYGQVVATRAAHHALEQTRVLNGSASDGEAIAHQLLDQTGVLNNPQVTASRTATQATVTVTGDALSMLPGVALPVTATATGPVERLDP
jgi:hypothetical protein